MTIKTFLKAWAKNKDYENAIEDLANHGCASGIIGELIYDADLEKFYSYYQEEINETIDQYLDETGLSIGHFLDSLKIDSFSNIIPRIVWFVVELKAHEIMNGDENE